jgi:hypothetical protein
VGAEFWIVAEHGREVSPHCALLKQADVSSRRQ